MFSLLLSRMNLPFHRFLRWTWIHLSSREDLRPELMSLFLPFFLFLNNGVCSNLGPSWPLLFLNNGPAVVFFLSRLFDCLFWAEDYAKAGDSLRTLRLRLCPERRALNPGVFRLEYGLLESGDWSYNPEVAWGPGGHLGTRNSWV